MREKYVWVVILLTFAATAFSQSGGGFTISQAAIASGGGVSAGGAFSAGATAGQPVTETSSGQGFALSSGFWQPGFTPTAAGASVSGRVSTSDGRGIANAVISITNTRTGGTRSARTGSFGFYSIDELPTGETYILTVNSKRFVFTNPSRVITLADNAAGEDFIADAPDGQRSSAPAKQFR